MKKLELEADINKAINHHGIAKTVALIKNSTEKRLARRSHYLRGVFIYCEDGGVMVGTRSQ
ncbi:MAG: hypothetical protein BMS9Abin31_0487 [Gammaproteobacteria bacterium]|nr:MAG: hypothetical protein BMS9Abin31_0487 [Gammaproteobacteria bacterium]